MTVTGLPVPTFLSSKWRCDRRSTVTASLAMTPTSVARAEVHRCRVVAVVRLFCGDRAVIVRFFARDVRRQSGRLRHRVVAGVSARRA